MTFEEFKANVQNWAKERGIYEHSTPLAQAMKAGSESGELMDAIIKDQPIDLIDSIGDIAVCLVNYAHMTHNNIDFQDIDIPTHEVGNSYYSNLYAANAFAEVGLLISKAACKSYDTDHINIKSAMYFLEALVISKGLHFSFMDSCEAAWNEIKDRKGFMSSSGAFVKE